ncbi:MAG TPA: penicillin-binding protein 2 [Armatimonadota bacterium]|nr:penicillin-binding protein 2 [Armatimonadota bacterium]
MKTRQTVLRLAVVLIFGLLAARLWQIQIIGGRDYRRASEENRIRLVRRQAPRGVIYDRRGRILAANRLCLDLVVIPQELGREPGGVERVAEVVGEKPARVAAAVKAGDGQLSGVVVAHDVPLAVATRAAESSLHLSGVQLQSRPVRHYPLGMLAAHVLGYVREISAQELQRMRDSGYNPRDRVGKDGVERELEASLRGSDGGEQVEVDARGRLVRVLGQVAPTAGDAVTLNLDADVQRAAEKGLAGRRGAAVVMDAHSGEVLALASSPAFDPNIFNGRLSSAQWAYLNSAARPQQDRAATALYEPGSVFKVITAAAAIERGVAGRHSRFFCPGYYQLGKWRFSCWQKQGHGSLDLLSGIAQSCNVMFIKLGRGVGRAELEHMARAFGLGSQTGIDLPDESSGLVPNPRWKRSRLHQPWYPGDTCQMAVGQGGVLVTPLQAVVVTAAIANGGHRVTPHLLRAVGGSRVSAPAPRSVGIKPATAALVREGMAEVVRRGTARRIWDPNFPVGGKTGTAENPHGKPHAWFVGFAPVARPQVVVAVVVEQGGHGSAAAPIGAALLRAALREPAAPSAVAAGAPQRGQ